MPSALPEATKPGTNGISTKLTGEQLREAGWTAPQAFDYESADVNPSDAAPPAPAEDGDEVPGWAHNAASTNGLRSSVMLAQESRVLNASSFSLSS